MVTARIRLAFLWLAQVARNLADNCLWMFAVLQVARVGPLEQEAAWHQASAAFYLPFILLAPIHGALSNSLPRHWVLAGASGYSLVVVGILLALLGPDATGWAWCAGMSVCMVGAAVFSPARYALLPAAAEDTQIPLNRVNGWMEMGGAAAIVAGLLLAIRLQGMDWLGAPAALVLVIGMYLLALASAWPVQFPSDVRRADPPAAAIAGFFGDAGRIWTNRETRGSLLGLAFFLALVVAGGGVIMAHTGALGPAAQDSDSLTHLLLLMIAGTAAGSLLASVQGNPHRSLGLVTFAAIGTTLVLIGSAFSTDLRIPTFLIGLFGGLANVPLRTTYQSAVPADARGNAMAISNTANYLLILILSVLLSSLVYRGLLTPLGQLILLIVLAALASAACCWFLLRPTLEQIMEFLFWPIHRTRARGPGKRHIPERGPLVIIGNHTAWFDPAFVAKIAPRQIRAMMTSEFYDLPIMHFFMKHVFQAIRVQSSRFRREAPELEEAVTLVQEGGCLLLFPEGWMRRKENMVMRQFGQGIWHILRRCPGTPVVCIWVEGGWGSWASYAGGPPTQNKKFDFFRSITIGVQEPIVVPDEILADHRATRRYLWQRVVEARRFLGLDVPQAAQAEEEEAEEEKETST